MPVTDQLRDLIVPLFLIDNSIGYLTCSRHEDGHLSQIYMQTRTDEDTQRLASQIDAQVIRCVREDGKWWLYSEFMLDGLPIYIYGPHHQPELAERDGAAG